MSLEYFNALKNYGASAVFVGIDVSAGNDLHDIVAATTNSSGGVGGATVDRTIRNHYVRGMGAGSYMPLTTLDGVNDYWDTDNTACPNAADSDFSIVMWVDYGGSTPASNGCFCGARASATVSNVSFFTGVSGTTITPTIYLDGDTGSQQQTTVTTGLETNDGAHMLGLTVDWSGAADTNLFYWDGELVAGTVNANNALGAVASAPKLYIGSRNNNGTADLFNNCGLGPFAWFSGAILTATQMANLYRLARMPEMRDSVFYMDEAMMV
jgi:hypothetical protein